MSVLHIDIYENDRADADHLTRSLQQAAIERGLIITTTVHRHATDIINAIEQRDSNLVILDIDMDDDVNGLAVAGKLRRWNTQLPIAFVTSLSEYALQAYSVQPLHYLLKPVDCAEAGELLDRCPAANKLAAPTISVVSDRTTLAVPIASILYAEARRNNVTIHTTEQDIDSYTSLSELAQRGGETLIRCHRSFLVNATRIAGVEGNEFVLDNDAREPIRVNGRNAVIAQYHERLARLMER